MHARLLPLAVTFWIAGCAAPTPSPSPSAQTPADFSLWAWATASSGLFGSNDNGATWTKASDVPSIPVGAAKLTGSHLAITRQGVVSLSTDSGKTWSESPLANLPAQGVTAFFAGSTLYAGTNGALYRSLDGQTWARGGTGLPTGVNSVESVTQAGSTVLVTAALAGLFRSTDGGATFAASNGAIPASVFNNAVTASVVTWNGKLFAAFQGSGVWVSQDDGLSWTLSSSGLPSTGVGRLWPIGSRLFAAPPTAGLFVSTDGATWVSACALPANESVLKMFDVGSTLFLVTTNSAKAGLFVSSDSGQTCTASPQAATSAGSVDPVSWVMAR